MMNPEEKKTVKDQNEPVDQNKPDEELGFIFSSAIKIFDPETKEVFVQIRGD